MVLVKRGISSPIVRANHQEVGLPREEDIPVEEMDNPIKEEIMARTTMEKGTDLPGN